MPGTKLTRTAEVYRAKVQQTKIVETYSPSGSAVIPRRDLTE